MITPRLLLMIIALVLFLLGAIGVPARCNWTAAGLFCWLLSTMIA